MLCLMPELKSKTSKNKRSKAREFVYTGSERHLLKKIGLQIQHELHKQDKSREWLAFKIGLSRSALQEIMAGRSNPRLLTLTAIVMGLGFKDLEEFLSKI